MATTNKTSNNSLQDAMREEKNKEQQQQPPYSCRALSTSSRKGDAIMSSFICISLSSQPNMRIKIPRLLAKKKRNVDKVERASLDEAGNKSKKRSTTFPKKVGFMICKVFGYNKKKDHGNGKGKEEFSEQPNKEEGDQDKSFSFSGILKGRSSKVPLAKVTGRKIGRAVSVRRREIVKRGGGGCDGEEEGKSSGDEEEELCKKRILMGEKCKPLNLSGALHYDKNGVLLAEEVLP